MTKTLEGQEALVLSSSQIIMRLSVPRTLWMERFFMKRVALQTAIARYLIHRRIKQMTWIFFNSTGNAGAGITNKFCS